MNEKQIHTAECRFCGQVVQMEDVDLTEEQAQEEATMRCKCIDAIRYRKEKNRRKKALENVKTLFGSEREAVLNLLNNAVESIGDDEMERITVNLYGGVKCTISQNSKGEINVERTVTKKQKLSE